jgi:carbamate kinase
VRVVVALGGNALLERGERPDATLQERHVATAVQALAPLASDHQLVITHGNGPQVGVLAIESANDPTLSRSYPFDVLGAETQGMIGYWLLQALENALPGRQVASVVCQTVVEMDDPAFSRPTKFVGPSFSEEQARQLATERSWEIRQDGKWWRRVVASPEPRELVELAVIERLLEGGTVVICAGGGGIPVIRTGGVITGVEAVIDKDLAAALLARSVHAEALLLLTDVDAVQSGFGTPHATPIHRATVAELRALALPSGSMGPKVEAVCRFAEATGGIAAIGKLTDAVAVLEGTSGTRVIPSSAQTLSESGMTSPVRVAPAVGRGASVQAHDAGRPHMPLGVPALEDLPDPEGRRVLVRADLDIPLDFVGPLEQSRELRQLVPTMEWLIEHKAEVTICGHQGTLGTSGDVDRYLATVTALKHLFPEVRVAPNLSGWDHTNAHPAQFSALLQGQELFVNDDFRHSSFSLSSIIGPPAVLPSAAGRQMEADLGLLAPLRAEPERPLVVVLGSRDTLDRIPNLYSLVLRADAVLVGGQMSQPFLAAIGRQPPDRESLDFLEQCRHAYGVGITIHHPIHLPTDLVWECSDARVVTAANQNRIVGSICDIGPHAEVEFGEVLRGAGSVLWAGSLGKAEDPRFAQGTIEVGRSLLGSGARIVLGGDVLVATLKEKDLLPEAAGILSATGSAVALLKDGDLPGLTALRRTPQHLAFDQPAHPESPRTRPRSIESPREIG